MKNKGGYFLKFSLHTLSPKMDLFVKIYSSFFTADAYRFHSGMFEGFNNFLFTFYITIKSGQF